MREPATRPTSNSGPAKASRGRYRRTQDLADVIEEVFEDFDGSMSTRQVYYQCVSRGAVNNNNREYGRVQRLLVNLRRTGVIAFDRVVNRSRAKHHREGWDGVGQMLDTMSLAYRRDFWSGQDTHVMIACEKAALEGIFAEVVNDYGASLWTVRGYVSDGFAYEWATEIRDLIVGGKDAVVYYFGDHDPSGLDIEEKIQTRLRSHGAYFEWNRAGLLETDFDEFDLVELPVKLSDTRARSYLERHGDRAAELDALPPDVLRQRIHECFDKHIDRAAWERMKRTQAVERASLNVIARNFAVKDSPTP